MADHDLKSPGEDLREFFAEQQDKPTLRFLTCGSVDDGKSTLIGRLLYDTKLIFDDQLSVLKADTLKHGTTGGDIDFALLVDGLEAEREQGITIDVAYRYFATPARRFIVADTPGHEQYTRNMATGASTADLAILLVDARQGVLQQTRRHAHIASLLGIRHIVLAVNKIDLVDYSQSVFEEVTGKFREFADDLHFKSVTAIPISALLGDNVVSKSKKMGWYLGPTLLNHLESVDVASDKSQESLRLPIQYVSRPNSEFRGYCGTIASGIVNVGDSVIVAKSGKRTAVQEIILHGETAKEATSGDAVTLVLDSETEISRGDMLVSPEDRPHVADQFMANVVWFDEQPMLPGRSYILQTECDRSNATITELKHRIDVDTFSHDAAKALELNEIGVCNISTQSPIVFDEYSTNRTTGAFILIDRITNGTVGAGMIEYPLRRASNVHWQALDLNKSARSEIKSQKAAVLWFTGLSGSGKSTIANLLEKKLYADGRHTTILDGDNVRHGLNRDLGFTDEDRVENIRRVGEVSKLMVEAGLITIVSFISPFRAERRLVREMLGENEFIEIFVDTPFDECVKRDPKGLYARALNGEIKNFTGVDSPYELPERADVHLKTLNRSPEDLADELEQWLKERGYC